MHLWVSNQREPGSQSEQLEGRSQAGLLSLELSATPVYLLWKHLPSLHTGLASLDIFVGSQGHLFCSSLAKTMFWEVGSNMGLWKDVWYVIWDFEFGLLLLLILIIHVLLISSCLGHVCVCVCVRTHVHVCLCWCLCRCPYIEARHQYWVLFPRTLYSVSQRWSLSFS